MPEKQKKAEKATAHEVGFSELLGRALDILENMTDGEDCWFDHHGYCQAHNWFYTDPKCPHAEAKELLKERGRAA